MTENNYTNEKYPLSDLTSRIIKCAIEFANQHIDFEREFEMPLTYKLRESKP